MVGCIDWGFPAWIALRKYVVIIMLVVNKREEEDEENVELK